MVLYEQKTFQKPFEAEDNKIEKIKSNLYKKPLWTQYISKLYHQQNLNDPAIYSWPSMDSGYLKNLL